MLPMVEREIIFRFTEVVGDDWRGILRLMGMIRVVGRDRLGIRFVDKYWLAGERDIVVRFTEVVVTLVMMFALVVVGRITVTVALILVAL